MFPVSNLTLLRNTALRFVLFGTIAFVYLMWLAAPVCAGAPYVINTLDIRLEARGNNRYLVTETYNVTFSSMIAVFNRKLPLKSYHGNRVEVRDISTSVPYSINREDGSILSVQMPRTGMSKQQKFYF